MLQLSEDPTRENMEEAGKYLWVISVLQMYLYCLTFIKC